MTLSFKAFTQLVMAGAVSVLLATPCAQADNQVNTTIDDFSDSSVASTGFDRQFLDDTLAGGSTTTTQLISNGILRVEGDITPPRGQPGWASTVIPLSAMGQPFDASAHKGIRLLIKVTSGNVSLSANSTLVTNFDYHAAPIVVKADGDFHEVHVPFSAMKRTWSEQTALDPHTLNSLSIVAYSMQRAAFNFEVDDVGFY